MSVGIEIHDGGLAHVTLSRAEAGNAIGLETAHGLREAAHACAREDVRAVLLDGEGRSFCVGGDLREFSRFSGESLERHLLAVTEALHDALRTFATIDAPMVAAVQGAVAGAGIGLASAADVTLAADDASFTAAYTAIGYSPDAACELVPAPARRPQAGPGPAADQPSGTGGGSRGTRHGEPGRPRRPARC